VLTRSFEQLTDTFVLTMWPFYGLGVAAVVRLRRKRPDLARPYTVLGYPFVPAGAATRIQPPEALRAE
jgi:basic amino acid/polyamine antiporter, APA family